MNIIKKETNQLKIPKIKQELSLQTEPKQFDLAYSPKPSSPPYSAYDDKHAFSYFNKKSVQKNLKNLAKAVEQQPKSQKNYKFIRSISQWIKPLSIKQQINNNDNSQMLEGRSNKSKVASKRSIPIAQNQKIIKSKKSPYKVFPIFIKIQSETKVRNKAIQSACVLPHISISEPNVQESATLVTALPKMNKTNKKKIDALHSLKHKKFLDFLNKKKAQLSNSFKLIEKEIASLQNEK